ncbi:MAG TPA: acyltransferase [Candidatus Dormibacteraeota bacterium]|nr:acyltransferase [Candidatus Dormibacteraeota bacterium]
MGRASVTASIGRVIGRVRRWPSVLWRLEGKFKGVQFQGRCEFLGRPMLAIGENAQIIIGDGVRIASSVRGNPLGCPHPSSIQAFASGASILIGPRVGMSATVLFAARAIEIGEGTIFGSGAMVFDNDAHVPEGEWGWSDHGEPSVGTAKPVKIGRGVFVGSRAIILKGVNIGDRAIIGAGAVVTQDVPRGHIAVGNPARILQPKS